MMRHLRTRLRSLLRRDRLEQELDRELQFHIDMLTDQHVREGMAPDAARRAARQSFGAIDAIKDDVRDTWLSRLFETGVQDVRYGLRNLRRNPGFALVVILTMALGIGANTAIFSVVNGVLLRPLPYTDAGELVVLRQGPGDTIANDIGFSYKDIVDYRGARSLSDVVEFHDMWFILLGRSEPERLATGVVSANYFDVLGVRPLYGRGFVDADDRPGAPAVLILSNHYWQTAFGGDPTVIGRVFRMNDRPHTVIGVLPPVPGYPVPVDIYMTTSSCPFRSSPRMIESRQGRMMTAFARLRPGVTVKKAQADLDILTTHLAQTYPDDYPREQFHASATPLNDDLTRNFRPTLIILLATAGFVLLIVCASIANLLLARMVRRERELAVRAALGANRRRLLRQLLTESLLLAVTGGLLGLALAATTTRMLIAFASRFTARASDITIDPTVLIFTLALSVLTGIIFGSVPALTAKLDVAPALKDGTRATHGSHGLRSALIVGQVAVSFMLLIAAGLTLRSVLKLQSVDPGFRTDNILTMRIDLNFSKYPASLGQEARSAKMAAFWARLEERFAAMPGVVTAAGGGTFPLNERGAFSTGLLIEGHPLPPGVQPPQVAYHIATPDYFRTIGQPLVAGRPFRASDTLASDGVVIINQSMARHYWPNDNPIGKHVAGAADDPEWLTIVGVVADARDRLDQAPVDEAYVPLQQSPLLSTNWMVHSNLPVEQMIRQVKAAVYSLDPDQPVHNFRTLAEVRSETLAPPRLTATLIGIFALLALVITAAGIAGVIAFSVNQRTQEFGIRMALGARRASVLGMVVRQGLRLVAIGLVIGLAGALALTRLLAQLLFEVQPTDTLTFLAVSTVLLMVAVLACFVPARRAASVDPMVALRAL
ncbi:MAG TPA: ABC transporter permease [Vicinamibacterales bacterium]|nr:ABC transporter permease [Vicinamibacterales bacterium]